VDRSAVQCIDSFAILVKRVSCFVLSEAVLSAAVLVLSAAVLEVREPQTLLIFESKQSGLNRDFHRSNRSSLCSVIRARAPLR
jgi:hypothetical protein